MEKLESIFLAINKRIYLTYNKNKLKNGIKFDVLKDNIADLIKKKIFPKL